MFKNFSILKESIPDADTVIEGFFVTHVAVAHFLQNKTVCL